MKWFGILLACMLLLTSCYDDSYWEAPTAPPQPEHVVDVYFEVHKEIHPYKTEKIQADYAIYRTWENRMIESGKNSAFSARKVWGDHYGWAAWEDDGINPDYYMQFGEFVAYHDDTYTLVLPREATSEDIEISDEFVAIETEYHDRGGKWRAHLYRINLRLTRDAELRNTLLCFDYDPLAIKGAFIPLQHTSQIDVPARLMRAVHECIELGASFSFAQGRERSELEIPLYLEHTNNFAQGRHEVRILLVDQTHFIDPVTMLPSTYVSAENADNVDIGAEDFLHIIELISPPSD